MALLELPMMAATLSRYVDHSVLSTPSISAIRCLAARTKPSPRPSSRASKRLPPELSALVALVLDERTQPAHTIHVGAALHTMLKARKSSCAALPELEAIGARLSRALGEPREGCEAGERDADGEDAAGRRARQLASQLLRGVESSLRVEASAQEAGAEQGQP